VVTARELVVLSGSFTSHSMSVRRHRHLRGHASHGRYAVSNVGGREINLYKPPSAAARDRTRAAGVRGERSRSYSIAPPDGVVNRLIHITPW